MGDGTERARRGKNAPDPVVDDAYAGVSDVMQLQSHLGQAGDIGGAPLCVDPALAGATSMAHYGQQQQAAELRAAGMSLAGEQTPGGAAAVDPPLPGQSAAGFIDHSDGSNIRTGPAESGGVALTDQPLPPATRVFVSGHHPGSTEWLYVTATLPDAIVRGYVQHFRVTTDVPEPTARLHTVAPGETAEALAVEMFADHVEPGRDLRFYENVLLHVNRQAGRDGVRGEFQDPNILGGGSNNVQLVAGQRIWLPGPTFALSLSGQVPDGSFTDGAVADARATLAHIDDLIASVTHAPDVFDEVAGEYADAIRAHLPEIIGVTAAFITAEIASMFLATTPTGVGQIAAAVIQLGLAAFGATAAATAAVGAITEAEAWLTGAWQAGGDAEAIAEASRAFVRMLVQIALAALAVLGAKANLGKGLKLADAIHITPPSIGMTPAMVTPEGLVVGGGPQFIPGSVASAGPVSIGGVPASGGYMLSKSLGGGGGKSNLEGQSRAQLEKSKQSYEELIAQHEQKLADYKANPLAHDNKGILAKAPPEIQAKIIAGRIKSLEKQIAKQKGELEKILELLGESGS